MIDIYNCNEYGYKFELLCHTSIRKYHKGKTYTALLEPRGNCGEDSNNQIFTSVWVNSGDRSGSRFTVVGNIYYNNSSIWEDFTKYFYCPIQLERKNKILKIKNLINSK